MDIEQSVFAPSDTLLRDYDNAVIDGQAFSRRYLWELRALWRQESRVGMTVPMPFPLRVGAKTMTCSGPLCVMRRPGRTMR